MAGTDKLFNARCEIEIFHWAKDKRIIRRSYE